MHCIIYIVFFVLYLIYLIQFIALCFFILYTMYLMHCIPCIELYVSNFTPGFLCNIFYDFLLYSKIYILCIIFDKFHFILCILCMLSMFYFVFNTLESMHCILWMYYCIFCIEFWCMDCIDHPTDHHFIKSTQHFQVLSFISV